MTSQPPRAPVRVEHLAAWLRDERSTLGDEALRERLIEAGHDPRAVDIALELARAGVSLPPPATPGAVPKPHKQSWQAAPAPSEARRTPRQLMLVFLVAFLPSVAGSAILPVALGDTQGWTWLLFAPLGGFVGGLAAGVVIVLRQLAWTGFFVGVLGCAVAQGIAWLIFSGGDAVALPFFLVPGLVPFVVGCGVLWVVREAYNSWDPWS